jgi:SAM-dependent methyltransferase
MKIRDSGMPDEATWSGFFDPETVLGRLRLTAAVADVVEFGCGYGTFTIPAARIAAGTVHALDLEPAMIERTRARAAEAGLDNVAPAHRDFLVDGSGLPDASADYAMVFNILHLREPAVLLGEALRNLKPGGLVAFMHWNYDVSTPRGPALTIRPRPRECVRWAEHAGFERVGAVIDLPPYHWGAVLRRPGE